MRDFNWNLLDKNSGPSSLETAPGMSGMNWNPDLSKVFAASAAKPPDFNFGIESPDFSGLPPGDNMPTESSWNWFDKTDKNGMTTQGVAGLGFGVAKMLAGLYLGNKQMGMAQDQLDESKRQFGLNFGAQKKDYNSKAQWQHDARKGYDPNYSGKLTQI